jgi:hypothetical protein
MYNNAKKDNFEAKKSLGLLTSATTNVFAPYCFFILTTKALVDKLKLPFGVFIS